MKMKSVLPAAGVLTLVAGGVGLALWESKQASARQTAEAQAIGFVAAPVKWWDGTEQEDVHGHTLTFSWLDGQNQPHTQTMKEITWYDPARSYKVCYNPQDPSDWKLYSSDHVCGS
jgi:hypothetical protein